jgi:hypothetical protein
MTKIRQRSRVRHSRVGPPQPARADRPVPNLSDHDLKQMDDALLDGLSESVSRELLRQVLADLRLVRSQLSQLPGEGAWSTGTMPAGPGGAESAGAVGEGRVLAPEQGGELESKPDGQGHDSGSRA